MKQQKTQNYQNNHKKREQVCRHNPSGLQTILQSYNNQNSLVLVKNRYIYINGTG